jgi:hypothetical protein
MTGKSNKLEEDIFIQYFHGGMVVNSVFKKPEETLGIDRQ